MDFMVEPSHLNKLGFQQSGGKTVSREVSGRVFSSLAFNVYSDIGQVVGQTLALRFL